MVKRRLVSEDNDSPVADADDYGGRLEKTSINRKHVPEEEKKFVIPDCMFLYESVKKGKEPVYKCRYCPTIVCLNDATTLAHVSSKKHAKMEKLVKEGKRKPIDLKKLSQKKQKKEEKKRSVRRIKKLQTQERIRSLLTKHGANEEVGNTEIPSQEKQKEENSWSRKQLKRDHKQEKSSLTKQGENEDATQKSSKKRRQTKD